MKPQNTSATTWNRFRQTLGWFWLVACLTAAWLSWHPSVPATISQQLESNAESQWSHVSQTTFPSNEAKVSETSSSGIRFISTDSLVSESRKLRTKPIEQIKIGERVAAFNPELSEEEHRQAEPDWSTYKQVALVTYQEGVRYDVELLRPTSWFEESGVKIGGTVHLHVEEMGLDAEAVVEAIQPSPAIKKGAGRVVTGTFRHPAGNIRNLYVDGLTEPIGATEYHPFWVESRLAFAQVKDLKPDERLLSSLGRTHAIQRIEERPSTEMVFNLEVEHEHCYQIGSFGLLCHNGCNDKLKRDWEKANGKPWPIDPKTGRGQDAHHIEPRADGGKHDASNITPMPHDDHVKHHQQNGDSKRWGSWGGKKKVN